MTQLFCKVINGTPQPPMVLPLHIEGILNFNLYPNPEEFGYYRFFENEAPETDPLEFEVTSRLAVDEEAKTVTRAFVIQELSPEEKLARLPQLDDISDRQFFNGLLRRGKIDDEQFLSAVSVGTVPPDLLAIINSPQFEAMLPALGKSKTEVLGFLMGAKTFQFNHPISGIIAGLYGWDDTDFREFWNECIEL